METKLKIIWELEKRYEGIHFREISRLVKSGLPNIKRFLDKFEKEGVVRKVNEANLVKFKLKESQKTLAYLKQLNTERYLLLPVKVQDAVNEFLNELEIKPLIFLIFGSYAKGNHTKDSDIDILLIFQKVEGDKDIENTAKKVSMRTNTKINPVYLDYKNFERNFLDKEHDFSREIRRNVIVIHGIENYYHLLWRFLK